MPNNRDIPLQPTLLESAAYFIWNHKAADGWLVVLYLTVIIWENQILWWDENSLTTKKDNMSTKLLKSKRIIATYVRLLLVSQLKY